MVVIRAGKIEAIEGRYPMADPRFAHPHAAAFRKFTAEVTNLYFEDAVRIRELRMFARDGEWKTDDDRAVGSLKQLGDRRVFMRLRDGRWFLENRQTNK